MSTTYTSELLDNKDESFVEVTSISGSGMIEVATMAVKRKILSVRIRSLILPAVHSLETNINAYHAVHSGSFPPLLKL